MRCRCRFRQQRVDDRRRRRRRRRTALRCTRRERNERREQLGDERRRLERNADVEHDRVGVACGVVDDARRNALERQRHDGLVARKRDGGRQCALVGVPRDDEKAARFPRRRVDEQTRARQHLDRTPVRRVLEASDVEHEH